MARMRNLLTGVVTLAVAVSALAQAPPVPPAPPVRWTPQHSGVTVRLRGVSAVSSTVAWASGAQGTVLRTTDGGTTWLPRPVPNAETLDFRDVDAISAEVAYILSIGNGESSRIYKTRDGGATWTLQLANTDPKVFLDAMAFRDEQHGVAFSDSVDGRFVVFTTADGGATWPRVPADRLPPALPGEGAFAASGSNVALGPGGRIWIGTTRSRVLRSADDGRTWSVVQTPVATGEATGIFSIAFRDAQHGVVVGGNYQQETAADRNVAFTIDGGSTWTAAAAGRGLSGFRSAVVPWPGKAAAWLAVGPSGSDWSADNGHTWSPAGGDGSDAISLAPGGAIGWASGAGGRIAVARPADAQLSPKNAAGVTYGHVHLNVSDLDVHKKLWVDLFGGEFVQKGPLAAVKFRHMLVALTVKAPTGPSQGTVMDHFGFRVRSMPDILAKLRAQGYEVQTQFTGAEGFPNAYVLGPDGLRIEMQEDTTLDVPAVPNHIHFWTPEFVTLLDWYVDTFSLTKRARGRIQTTADAGAMNLSFQTSPTPIVGTKGRVIDHIGFEVADLAAFCKKLEAKGITFDVPYRDVPSIGLKIAFFTDPSGVYIELTEGYDKY